MTTTLVSLNSGWTISAEHKTDSAFQPISVSLPVPGDLHSALLDAGEIDDPYWRDNETHLDWVHETVWVARKHFTLNEVNQGDYRLRFDCVDCLAEVSLNNQVLGLCESQFLYHDFAVQPFLRAGKNTLEVRFLSNSLEAKKRAQNSRISTPYMALNSRIGHFNFLRKAQCHGGWDWNIALSPLGFYGNISLLHSHSIRLDELSIRQHHEPNAVTLAVTFHLNTTGPCQTELSIHINQHSDSLLLQAVGGENQATLRVRIDNPQLWWPVGQGAQNRYEMIVKVGQQTQALQIGLRHIELLTTPDPSGQRFAFKINGRELFCKGANWVPADALPARATLEKVRDLLQSAVDANMNMIRVWGGGQYEADWFYELCDELGLMVWQDFMFACHLYPAHQRHWLDLVRQEAHQQLRRLSRFACIVLWCGDNELIGALNWYEASRQDRDRYLVIYARLNHALEECLEDENIDPPFWPSSPSVGRLNFADGWHTSTAGDMHFWDVWHCAKDFEHYRSVRPRFCSEFGFQSFPSLRVINSFTQQEDHDFSCPVMETHQRNQGGNKRILETIARYFPLPEDFAERLYLSQLSQGLAMKTAIEFWRTNKPHTMGTLYWQLNDTWPVASWSSLEYGGGWKVTHYLAKRFYADILISAQPDTQSDDILLYAVSDRPTSDTIKVRVRRINTLTEHIDEIGQYSLTTQPSAAINWLRIASNEVTEHAIFVFDWYDKDGRHGAQSDYLPKPPKAYRLHTPNITINKQTANTQTLEEQIILTSDHLALFVTYDHGGDTIYSDNCFTLLPHEPKILTITRSRSSHLKHHTAPRIDYLKANLK